MGYPSRLTTPGPSRELRIQFPVFPPFATDWAAMDNALIFRSFRAFPPWTQRNPIGPKTGCRVTKAGDKQRLKLRALDGANPKRLWKETGNSD